MTIDTRRHSPFPLRNRLLRLLWGLVWGLLGRPSPRPLHAWRALLLRTFGARLGRGVHVYPGARVWAPWNLEMGDQAALGDGVDCYNQAPITLGRRALVSQRAFLCTGSHDYRHPHHPLTAAPIVIGAEAWVCAQAYVGPGVTVGEGAVVGACAVVTRDVEPWRVVAGNPAREVNRRRLAEPPPDEA